MAKSERLCPLCHKTYYRSHRVRLWVGMNFGHRLGWKKVEQVVCCKCMGSPEARSVLHEVSPKLLRLVR